VTETPTIDGSTPEGSPRPHRPSSRAHLIGALAIVALAVIAIVVGVLIASDDDDDGSSTVSGATTEAPADADATTVAPTTVAPTTAAPSPTVAGVRYQDEIFTDVTVDRDLPYGSAPGADGAPVALTLDLYRPAGDQASDRPALVWVHGGGFKNGDKAEGVSAVMAPLYARLGYVVVSINYRLLAPESCSGANGVSPACFNAGLEAVHDGQAAVRWLRANASTYGIDPDRIVIGGESAGGIVATGVGVHSDDPGTSGNPGYPSTVVAFFSISGGVPGGLFVDATDSPGLLVSGTADDVVPYQWSVDTTKALNDAGVASSLTTFDGAGHVPFAEYGEQMEQQSIEFFYEHLDLAAA
jgi:acetyl esterase/lipase